MPISAVPGKSQIPPTSPRGQLLLAVFMTALAIRIALIFYFDTWHISPEGDHWSFGFETGRLARSLADGRGFSSPFHSPTGPTAWLAPGYPWLLSLLFRVFGIFSPAAALAALLIDSFLSAVTCLVIYKLGREFYDEPTGLLGAALFALSPASIWHTITSIWDVTASTLLLALLLCFLRRFECAQSHQTALMSGVIAGVLALFNPACLIVYIAGGGPGSACGSGRVSVHGSAYTQSWRECPH